MVLKARFLLPVTWLPIRSMLAELPITPPTHDLSFGDFLQEIQNNSQQQTVVPLFYLHLNQTTSNIAQLGLLKKQMRVQLELQDLENALTRELVLELNSIGVGFDLWVYGWPDFQKFTSENSLRDLNVIQFIRMPIYSMLQPITPKLSDIRSFVLPLLQDEYNYTFPKSQLALMTLNGFWQTENLMIYDDHFNTQQLQAVLTHPERALAKSNFRLFLRCFLMSRLYWCLQGQPSRRWIFGKLYFIPLLPLFTAYWYLRSCLLVDPGSPHPQQES